jgi:hypothetical protein
MTILSVAQDVAPFIGITKPTSLMGSTVPEHEELAAIANRAADYISKAYDWQKLTKLHTLTGDGVTTEFAFPADYRKFTDDSDGEAEIQTSIGLGPLCRVRDLSEWLRREVRQIGQVTYSWIIYNDKIHIKPALPVGETASYFYQSKNIVSDSGAVPVYRAFFAGDGDVFRLDERMFMLCVLWMWRHAKQQSYAQYQQEFEERKSDLITNDKGSRSLKFGRSYRSSGVVVAYPYGLPQ